MENVTIEYTPEELEFIMREVPWNYVGLMAPDDVAAARVKFIELVQKEKVQFWSRPYKDSAIFICPMCGARDTFPHRYCPNCGQRLEQKK